MYKHLKLYRESMKYMIEALHLSIKYDAQSFNIEIVMAILDAISDILGKFTSIEILSKYRKVEMLLFKKFESELEDEEGWLLRFRTKNNERYLELSDRNFISDDKIY